MVKKNAKHMTKNACAKSEFLKQVDNVDLSSKHEISEDELLRTHETWLMGVVYHQLLKYPRWLWESRVDDVVQEARFSVRQLRYTNILGIF